MGKAIIGDDGAHLWGCECHDCTATNAVCPECGREYFCFPDRHDLDECPRCMWQPERA